MFTPDILIGTDTFALRSQRSTSSERADTNQTVSEPRILTIAHERAKSNRISSVVYIDDTKLVQSASSVLTPDVIRALVKIQYSPLSGRTATEADVKLAITQLIAFLSVEANVNKLLLLES